MPLASSYLTARLAISQKCTQVPLESKGSSQRDYVIARPSTLARDAISRIVLQLISPEEKMLNPLSHRTPETIAIVLPKLYEFIALIGCYLMSGFKASSPGFVTDHPNTSRVLST
jgi:hypothetical protein